MFTTISLAFLWPFLVVVQAQNQATSLTPIWFDNVEYLVANRNIRRIPWPPVQAALATPNRTNEVALDKGYDWTKPYPGVAVAGHKIHLRTAYDVPLSDNSSNQTTSITAMTFSIPDSMKESEGKPKQMDKSWYLCRHVFVSRVAKDSSKADPCGFLGQECTAALKENITKNWLKDDTFPCSTYPLDGIPPQCEASFGFARGDVMGFDAEYMNNETEARILAVDEQGPMNWRLGTGSRAKGDKTAYELANNRTFLVATVWGYSKQANVESRKTPEATLSCISAGKESNAGKQGNSPNGGSKETKSLGLRTDMTNWVLAVSSIFSAMMV